MQRKSQNGGPVGLASDRGEYATNYVPSSDILGLSPSQKITRPRTRT